MPINSSENNSNYMYVQPVGLSHLSIRKSTTSTIASRDFQTSAIKYFPWPGLYILECSHQFSKAISRTSNNIYSSETTRIVESASSGNVCRSRPYNNYYI